MTPLTIFWTSVTPIDRASLDEAAELRQANVVRVNSATLAKHALAAIVRGPVICIVRTDREAGQALGLGIDEILREGEVTRTSLEGAVVRARARAAVRASPAYRHALLDQDEEAAFATLGAALGERLETPLAMASVDCAAVADAMNCLIEVDDQFVAWTALVAPSEYLRSLIARRLSAPTAPELKGVLKRLRASIGRAESLVRLLRDLTRPGDAGDQLAVATLLGDIVDVMRQVTNPWADITVEADSECFIAASRTTLVVVMGLLLANALDSVRAASRGKGSISVHAFEAEDVVVIEVRDDGREVPSDLRPDLLDHRFGDAPGRPTGLQAARDRVRRSGGDLLVDSDPTGTSVRVFLPSARAHGVVGIQAVTEQTPISPRKTES